VSCASTVPAKKSKNKNVKESTNLEKTFKLTFKLTQKIDLGIGIIAKVKK